jgi:hypothetical protein
MQAETATQQGRDHVMMPLTPDVQIDELRRAIDEAEQRRQVAEDKLADCERRLGTASQTMVTQDRRIGWLTSEVARLRNTGASTVPADYAGDAMRFSACTATAVTADACSTPSDHVAAQ